MTIKKFSLLGVLILMSSLLFAQAPSYRMLVAGSATKHIAIVEKDGRISWKHGVKKECNQVTMLADGSILYSDKNAASLITQSHDTLWHYKSAANGEIQSASVLDNGSFLLMQNGNPAKLIEINRKGKVKFELEIPTMADNPHRQFRNITKTPQNTYLIPYFKGDKVCEYDKKGNLLRTIDVEGTHFTAKYLKSGNVMIAGGDGHSLTEVDAKGNIVWQLKENDLPNNILFFVAEFKELPNGNLMIANWGGHGHKGEQAQLIEVSRDKKVVWSFKNWQDFGPLSTFQILE